MGYLLYLWDRTQDWGPFKNPFHSEKMSKTYRYNTPCMFFFLFFFFNCTIYCLFCIRFVWLSALGPTVVLRLVVSKAKLKGCHHLTRTRKTLILYSFLNILLVVARTTTGDFTAISVCDKWNTFLLFHFQWYKHRLISIGKQYFTAMSPFFFINIPLVVSGKLFTHNTMYLQ